MLQAHISFKHIDKSINLCFLISTYPPSTHKNSVFPVTPVCYYLYQLVAGVFGGSRYIYIYIYIYNDHLNLAKIVDRSFVLVVDNLCESSVFSSSF